MIQLYKNIIDALTGKERKQFYWILLFNEVVNIADIFSLALLLLVIDFYIHPSGNSLNFLPAWLSDHDSPALIALFFVIFSLKNLLAYLVTRWQFVYAYTIAGRISREELLNCLEAGYPEHTHVDSSVFIRKIGQQPTEFSQYVLIGLQQIISQTILATLAIASILLFKAKLFFLLLLILLPPVFIAGRLMKKKLKTVRTQTRSSSEKAMQHLKEALDGYIESHIYNASHFFSDRYAHFQNALNKQLADLQIIQGLPNRLIEVFAVLGLFILILIGKTSGTSSENIITIGAFMAAAYKIIPGIVKIINTSGQISAYKFSIEGFSLKNQNITEEKEPGTTPKLNSVQLKNIQFQYKNRPVLNNFSLCIQTGDFLVITGESGAGKTTILNLLLGFVTPQSGEILFNKINADTKDIQSYYSRISYVKQQSFLVHDTLLKNITLQENMYNVKKLQCALEVSGLNKIIETWPEGLNKIITENGKNISGGQRQRIAIARAIYKDSDLVIMDEPFNELDEESELVLLQKIREISESGTMIILITHNKRSVSFSTKMISLDEG